MKILLKKKKNDQFQFVGDGVHDVPIFTGDLRAVEGASPYKKF